MHVNYSTPPGKRRIFIGIPVDDQSQRLINRSLRPLRKIPVDIRWVPENSRHMTLAFLGDIPGSVIDDLRRGFDEAYRHRSRFQYCLSALTRFPDSMGRIIALTGQPAESLGELYQATRKLLDNTGIEFDQKKFRPHITLARIKKAQQVKTTFDQQTDISLNITSVVLYQSMLTHTGSIYSRLKESKLTQ